MGKVFYILLLSMYIMGCTSSVPKQQIEVKTKNIQETQISQPEDVIFYYYEAIKKGNKDKMNIFFISDKNLFLENPIPNINYEIMGMRYIEAQEAIARNEYSFDKKLEVGDIEVIVKETIKNNTEEITFILRKIDETWKIYSHSIGYYI